MGSLQLWGSAKEFSDWLEEFSPLRSHPLNIMPFLAPLFLDSTVEKK